MIPENQLNFVNVVPEYLDYNDQTDLRRVSCRGSRRISELTGSLTHDWTMYLEDNRIKLTNNDDYEQYIDYDLTGKTVHALSFAFDQSMNLNYAVSYTVKGSDIVKCDFVNYDVTVREYRKHEFPEYRQIYLILDDRRPSQSHLSDVVLIGVRTADNKIVLRNQRERFQQEHVTVTINPKDDIIKAGMTRQFAVMLTLRRYIKTLHYQAFLGVDGVPLTLFNGDPIWSIKQS